VTRIYTRTGDKGRTGLIGGRRVSKDHPRVAAYGDVDELNALLGLARAGSRDAPLDSLLHGVQRDLFAIGAQLADPTSAIGSKRAKAAIGTAAVERLEAAIDARETALPPLTAFVLPGGSELGALLHLARTVCRRAERGVVTLARKRALDPNVVAYLNRLSDLLFVLARHENHRAGKSEDRW
jgi:cob(I)alamin adenosyltransferase